MKVFTCVLDYSFITITPLITFTINHSLQAGYVPCKLKTAVRKPLPKKPTLDPDILTNHRLVSNLPFLSKVLKKAVSTQLYHHLLNNSVFEKFQSGFRPGLSIETALVRVTNLLMTADTSSTSFLILLDLTAAFGTVDHNILLYRLHSTFCLTDTALTWFALYLTDRTEYVALGEAKSNTHRVTCVILQGSVLGSTLFNLHMLTIGHVISKHRISFHCYVDFIPLLC